MDSSLALAFSHWTPEEKIKAHGYSRWATAFWVVSLTGVDALSMVKAR
jgi:hypothetical protein